MCIMGKQLPATFVPISTYMHLPVAIGCFAGSLCVLC